MTTKTPAATPTPAVILPESPPQIPANRRATPPDHWGIPEPDHRRRLLYRSASFLAGQKVRTLPSAVPTPPDIPSVGLLPGAELAVRTAGAIRRGLAEHISMTVISSAAKIRFREDLVFESNTAIYSAVEPQHHEHITAAVTAVDPVGSRNEPGESLELPSAPGRCSSSKMRHGSTALHDTVALMQEVFSVRSMH